MFSYLFKVELQTIRCNRMQNFLEQSNGKKLNLQNKEIITIVIKQNKTDILNFTICYIKEI